LMAYPPVAPVAPVIRILFSAIWSLQSSRTTICRLAPSRRSCGLLKVR
jgi:hypothetical protein